MHSKTLALALALAMAVIAVVMAPGIHASDPHGKGKSKDKSHNKRNSSDADKENLNADGTTPYFNERLAEARKLVDFDNSEFHDEVYKLTESSGLGPSEVKAYMAKVKKDRQVQHDNIIAALLQPFGSMRPSRAKTFDMLEWSPCDGKKAMPFTVKSVKVYPRAPQWDEEIKIIVTGDLAKGASIPETAVGTASRMLGPIPIDLGTISILEHNRMLGLSTSIAAGNDIELGFYFDPRNVEPATKRLISTTKITIRAEIKIPGAGILSGYFGRAKEQVLSCVMVTFGFAA